MKGYIANLRKRQAEKETVPIPHAVWTNPLYFIAFGLGSGALPAPGTFGTLFAIPFYLVLQLLPLPLYLLATLIILFASAWLLDKLSKALDCHDHPGMCLDEFVGFFVTMIHVPPSISFIILGFILFRLFDIWKPWPISLIDKHWHGGLGMVMDDVVAGLFVCFFLQLIAYFT